MKATIYVIVVVERATGKFVSIDGLYTSSQTALERIALSNNWYEYQCHIQEIKY